MKLFRNSIKINDSNERIEKVNLQEVKADKLKYQFNSFSYWLVLLSLVLTIISLFSMINNDDFIISDVTISVIPDPLIGIEIAIGIVLMLVTFLTAEKIKAYNLKLTYFTFVLAGINIIRIFNVPLTFYTKDTPAYTTSTFITLIVELTVSSILLVLAGIISLQKINLMKKYRGVNNA
ncbi:MAG: hypothetical protein LBV58_02480 [Acholeplasmatales bacterium]|jgi:hypothetical protein|nr:hypothetical protein [Acholeplasmatales bacterium]